MLFTERAGDWWPESLRHTSDPHSRITIAADGRFEEAGGGQTVTLGCVRAWEPPHRLEFDYFPGTGPEHPTAVTITFAADGDGTTVTVVHGPTDASADLFALRVPAYAEAWELILAAVEIAAWND